MEVKVILNLNNEHSTLTPVALTMNPRRSYLDFINLVNSSIEPEWGSVCMGDCEYSHQRLFPVMLVQLMVTLCLV